MYRYARVPVYDDSCLFSLDPFVMDGSAKDCVRVSNIQSKAGSFSGPSGSGDKNKNDGSW